MPRFLHLGGRRITCHVPGPGIELATSGMLSGRANHYNTAPPTSVVIAHKHTYRTKKKPEEATSCLFSEIIKIPLYRVADDVKIPLHNTNYLESIRQRKSNDVTSSNFNTLLWLFTEQRIRGNHSSYSQRNSANKIN